MAKGFGFDRRGSKRDRQQQVFKELQQCRDRILGLAWQGYLQQGSGAILFANVKGRGEIDYIPEQRISDQSVRQLIRNTDPKLAAVVLYRHGDLYSIVTLSGPKSPPECYDQFSEELRMSTESQLE